MTSRQVQGKKITKSYSQAFTYVVVSIVLTSQLFLLSGAVAQPETEIHFEREFETSGSDSGLFDEPRSVAVNSRDRIIVTDSDRGSSADTNIHICDGWGHCSGFGERGTGIGQFSRAFGVAVDSRDRIIIADHDNNRIQICNEQGECSAFGGSSDTAATSSVSRNTVKAEPGKFNGPGSVAVDDQDQIIIADGNNDRIQVCNDEGSCTAFGSLGTNVGQFDAPRSLTVDNQNRIIVADSGNHRIQICNHTGSCSAFGERGDALGQFEWPWDVVVDSQDRIFITEEGNNRVQVCNYQGECTAFGSEGPDAGQFNSPRGIAVDSRDRIIVGDLGNNRVQIFGTRGPFHINSGLNDAWYNPVTSGQGFFITVFPNLGYVSLAWFTYDTELPAEDAVANLGDAGHRWITGLGTIADNQVMMNIDTTSDGIFDTATDVQHTDPPGSDGTIILTFDNCNSGIVEYDIPSIERQGTVPIQRVADDNVTLCQALDGELRNSQ